MRDDAFSSSGIAPVGVDMPPDDVAALQSCDRSDEDPPLAHDEVVSLDEQESEISGQIGLL